MRVSRSVKLSNSASGDPSLDYFLDLESKVYLVFCFIGETPSSGYALMPLVEVPISITEFMIMTLASILCVLGMFAPSSLPPGGPQCL